MTAAIVVVALILGGLALVIWGALRSAAEAAPQPDEYDRRFK